MLDDVAFEPLDRRPSDRLPRLSEGEGSLGTKHQRRSIELLTAREVPSRRLWDDHRRGWIEKTRSVLGFLALGQPETRGAEILTVGVRYVTMSPTL